MMMFPRILSAAAQRKLQAHLKKGGLVAYPTESCYGLGCVPTLPKALNQLIHLKKRPQHKGMIVIGHSLEQLQPLLQRPSENIFQTAFPNIKEAKGSTVHRRRVRKDRERCRAALLLYEPAFGLTKSLSGEFDFFHDSEIFCLAVHKNGLHGLMLHPFDCGTVGGGIAAAAGDAGIADGTVGLNGETHGNFAVGAACVLEEAHFGSSSLSGKEAGNQQSGG